MKKFVVCFREDGQDYMYNPVDPYFTDYDDALEMAIICGIEYPENEYWVESV